MRAIDLYKCKYNTKHNWLNILNKQLRWLNRIWICMNIVFVVITFEVLTVFPAGTAYSVTQCGTSFFSTWKLNLKTYTRKKKKKSCIILPRYGDIFWHRTFQTRNNYFLFLDLLISVFFVFFCSCTSAYNVFFSLTHGNFRTGNLLDCLACRFLYINGWV